MRVRLENLDQRFRRLYERSVELLRRVSDEHLFYQDEAESTPYEPTSVGENILRSSAEVEMTFGGITARLWDDPFEWTLPETLSDKARVAEYLAEVEATRQRGFAAFTDDADLNRMIPAPRDLRAIGVLLIDTLRAAEGYQVRGTTIAQKLADQSTAADPEL